MISRPSQLNRTIRGERSASHGRVSTTRLMPKVEYDLGVILQAAAAVREGREKDFLAQIDREENVE